MTAPPERASDREAGDSPPPLRNRTSQPAENEPLVIWLLGRCLEAVRRIERVATALSAGAVLAIMVLICLDVGGRYIFSSPIGWAFDLISIYLMAASFYWALSDTLRRGHHVTVDLVFKHFRRGVQLFWLTVGWGLASLMFGTVFLLAAERTKLEWLSGNVMGGAIHWPTWVALAIAATGFFILSCRLVLGTLAYGLMLIANVETSSLTAKVQEPLQGDA